MHFTAQCLLQQVPSMFSSSAMQLCTLAKGGQWCGCFVRQSEWKINTLNENISTNLKSLNQIQGNSVNECHF
jgi:hypothetical protein